MRSAAAYPPARPRTGGPAPQVAELFGRVESTEVETTCGDTDATIIDFSGTPAAIRLTARSNGALFTLTNRMNHETHEVAVLANQTEIIRLPRDRVRARNLVGASNAIVYVEGYYAAEDERQHAASALPPGETPPRERIDAATPPPNPAQVFTRRSSPTTQGFREARPYGP